MYRVSEPTQSGHFWELVLNHVGLAMTDLPIAIVSKLRALLELHQNMKQGTIYKAKIYIQREHHYCQKFQKS